MQHPTVITALRLEFEPIPGMAMSYWQASLPEGTRVAIAPIAGSQAVNLYAWVDADPSGPADYIREHVPPFEYIGVRLNA